MTGKWTNISKRMLFAYFMLGGLIFLFTPARVTSRLQLAYANMFRVPLSTGRAATLASRTPTATGVGVPAANVQQLRNAIANLKVQLRQANAKVDQLARLRTVPEWDRMAFLPADVTVVSPSQTELTINIGRKQRVAVGQFVMALSDFSLIGRVSDVLSHTAKVRLFSDPDSKIPVEIGLSGIKGVMQGRGDGTAKIPLVPTQQSVTVQAPVYVQKEPGVLDVPMVAGRVVECDKAPDKPLLWDITLRATCEIGTLDSVAVVMPGS